MEWLEKKVKQVWAWLCWLFVVSVHHIGFWPTVLIIATVVLLVLKVLHSRRKRKGNRRLMASPTWIKELRHALLDNDIPAKLLYGNGWVEVTVSPSCKKIAARVLTRELARTNIDYTLVGGLVTSGVKVERWKED